jgi:GNAT superfamily N-acetyltransferase
VVLDCEEGAANKLLMHTPKEGFIVHAPLNLLQSIKNKFPNAMHYVEDWMVIEKNNASCLRSKLVRQLRNKEDATELARLLSSRQDRPRRLQKKYVEWIRRMPLFGVFDQGRLVSYAGSFIQLPQIWLIGGVYTHPEYRNKGYASLTTSAITEQALKKAPQAGLLVRSDNYAAIRVYEKIGYRKITEKVWVDVGIGLKP